MSLHLEALFLVLVDFFLCCFLLGVREVADLRAINRCRDGVAAVIYAPSQTFCIWSAPSALTTSWCTIVNYVRFG